jgi:hypothetical protein
VQIEEGEVLIFGMAVHDDALHCVDGAVFLGRRVDVAPVEVDAVGVHPEVSPGHSIRVEDGKDVEDEVVPKDSACLAVLGQLIDDSRHYVRTWNLTGMHSSPYHDAFLISFEHPRLLPICKQQIIFKILLFFSQSLSGSDSQHFHRSSFKRINDSSPVIVYILIQDCSILNVIEESRVVLI